MWSPLPGMRQADLRVFQSLPAAAADLEQFADRIPPEKSVSASNSLSPHFTRRSESYLYPAGIGKADFIFIRAGDGFGALPPELLSELEKQLEVDPRYRKIYDFSGVTGFMKGGGNPQN
jgi:hypothetical protein